MEKLDILICHRLMRYIRKAAAGMIPLQLFFYFDFIYLYCL